MKNTAKRLLALTAASILPFTSYAATQSITANIRFEAPITLTKNSDINFGIVSAGVNDTYTISTAGVVTAAATGQSLGGTMQQVTSPSRVLPPRRLRSLRAATLRTTV